MTEFSILWVHCLNLNILQKKTALIYLIIGNYFSKMPQRITFRVQIILILTLHWTLPPSCVHKANSVMEKTYFKQKVSLFLSFISLAGSRSSGSNRSGSKNDANAAAGTQESGGRSGSGSESEKREKAPSERSAAPPSEHSVRSSHTIRSTHSHAQSLVCVPPGLPPQTPSAAAPGSPPDRDLSSVPPELTASRQSFRMAMGNPSEFFVDVMWCASGDPEGRLNMRRHVKSRKKDGEEDQKEMHWHFSWWSAPSVPPNVPPVSCGLHFLQWRRLEQITYPIMPSETGVLWVMVTLWDAVMKSEWSWMLAGFCVLFMYFTCIL